MINLMIRILGYPMYVNQWRVNEVYKKKDLKLVIKKPSCNL